MPMNNLIMMSVGDLILKHPDPGFLFELVAPVLGKADILVGQGENPITSRSAITCAKAGHTYRPEFAIEPEVIDVLKKIGFNVLTLASNHIWDAGIPGVEDTISGLRQADIACVGIGMNINEARQPVIIESKGTRIGFLNYNCVGPEATWANEVKPGCAYIHILTVYEMRQPSPESIPEVYTAVEPSSLESMVEDIEKLRLSCDVLVVNFHKGEVAVQAKLAGYEKPLCHAAIDAGADLILAEHAHILKGIEVYNGKIIFHGLGNFVCSMQKGENSSAPEGWTPPETETLIEELYGPKKKWKEIPNWLAFLLNYVPGDNPPSSYAPEDLITMIAKCSIENGKLSETSYLPCIINKFKQPEILSTDKRGELVYEYVDRITKQAGFKTRFEWKGDEVVVIT